MTVKRQIEAAAKGVARKRIETGKPLAVASVAHASRQIGGVLVTLTVFVRDEELGD